MLKATNGTARVKENATRVHTAPAGVIPSEAVAGGADTRPDHNRPCSDARNPKCTRSQPIHYDGRHTTDHWVLS